MKLKQGFELKELAGKYIVIARSESNLNLTSMITLNKTSKVLFESLSEEKSVEDLINVLLNKYDVSYEVAKTDVINFIKTLKDNKLLEGEDN